MKRTTQSVKEVPTRTLPRPPHLTPSLLSADWTSSCGVPVREFEELTDEQRAIIIVRIAREKVDANYVNPINCCFLDKTRSNAPCMLHMNIMFATVRDFCKIMKNDKGEMAALEDGKWKKVTLKARNDMTEAGLAFLAGFVGTDPMFLRMSSASVDILHISQESTVDSDHISAFQEGTAEEYKDWWVPVGDRKSVV